MMSPLLRNPHMYHSIMSLHEDMQAQAQQQEHARQQAQARAAARTQALADIEAQQREQWAERWQQQQERERREQAAGMAVAHLDLEPDAPALAEAAGVDPVYLTPHQHGLQRQQQQQPRGRQHGAESSVGVAGGSSSAQWGRSSLQQLGGARAVPQRSRAQDAGLAVFRPCSGGSNGSSSGCFLFGLLASRGIRKGGEPGGDGSWLVSEFDNEPAAAWQVQGAGGS